MKKLILLIVLLSMVFVGCSTHPIYDQKFVTKISNGGGGIMVTSCTATVSECEQEFISIGNGSGGNPPAIQLNNNVK
jgi:hypothetical protein